MQPQIIQGGMGVGVSSWQLASAVASAGQMGVVSGTALDSTLVRRLWDGDPGGHLRRAIAAFPSRDFADEVVQRYFRPEGTAPEEPYPLLSLHKRCLDAFRQRLIALANFVEVYLAKEGHDGLVGINYLQKIQIPTLPSLYGAMLAGVDYVLMGAGIPREIPGALDRLAQHLPASMRFDIHGASSAPDEVLDFDPAALELDDRPELVRPSFLPIVSSDSLATMMVRKANGSVEGFVVEGHTAGGHNVPPRGGGELNDRGEPVYGDRGVAKLDRVAALDLPFWVAGGTGSPEKLKEALEAGAAGVQVGTLFAYADESGLRADLKREVIGAARNGGIDVLTDGRASPTGFPFKAVRLEGTLSSDEVYAERDRVCDLGYLRTAYRREDGRIGFRCPAEPVDTFVAKGGDLSDAEGRKCLCNALCANIGMGQRRPDSEDEAPLLTSGDDLSSLGRFLGDRESYSAQDVIDYLLDT